MKNGRTLIATALLFAAFTVYVQAQERPLLTATIPFTFTVENSNLPAGTYTISTLPPYNMMKVQSADGRKVAMIPAIPSRTLAASEQTKLIFDHTGFPEGASVHLAPGWWSHYWEPLQKYLA